MQQVYPIFKVHSGSANRNENGGRCCIRKESAVTRKKGCPGVEPDIPNDLIKRQYLNLVCGSGMRHTYCRVGTHSPSEQLPVSLVLVRLVERNQQRPQTHMCLLCLFRYAFIIALWVEFARRIFCPVTIQSSVLKTCPKTNHFLGRISRGTRSGQIPRRRVSLSHRRCRRRCPGCGLAGEESLRRMSRGRQLPRCLRVVWRGGRKVCPCRAGNGCWRMGFLVRLE